MYYNNFIIKKILNLCSLAIFFICLAIGMSGVSCSSYKSDSENSVTFKLDTLTYFDQSRNRKIPVAIYQPKNQKKINRIPILFSHGYGMNHGDAYIKDYPYLLEFLAEKGFFVVSIQHELKTDEEIPRTGNIREVRMPFWERGSKNIEFVLQQIQKKYPQLKYDQLAIIGHSNGGDMSALFAEQFPQKLNKIITLDNRRYGAPNTIRPKIYTLRSNDYPADEGVLPTEEDQKKFEITIQKTNINHDKMDNDANDEERKLITTKILEYLNEK